MSCQEQHARVTSSCDHHGWCLTREPSKILQIQNIWRLCIRGFHSPCAEEHNVIGRADIVWDQYFDNSLKGDRPEKSVLVAKSPETCDSVQHSTKELAAVSSGEQQQR